MDGLSMFISLKTMFKFYEYLGYPHDLGNLHDISCKYIYNHVVVYHVYIIIRLSYTHIQDYTSTYRDTIVS